MAEPTNKALDMGVSQGVGAQQKVLRNKLVVEDANATSDLISKMVQILIRRVSQSIL